MIIKLTAETWQPKRQISAFYSVVVSITITRVRTTDNVANNILRLLSYMSEKLGHTDQFRETGDW